jgi:6-phosphogluconolactonase
MKSLQRSARAIAPLVLLALGACGGGGGGGSSGSSSSPTTTPIYLTLAVSGLPAGTSVTLQDASSALVTPDALNVTSSQNGQLVAFPSQLSAGATYSVSIKTQPLHGACVVSNPSGTLGSTSATLGLSCYPCTEYAYTGTATNGLVSYCVASSPSGLLVPADTAPPSGTGTAITSLVLAPSGSTANPSATADLLYAAGSGSQYVSGFDVSNTGAYAQVAGNTTSVAYPTSIALNQADKVLYVANAEQQAGNGTNGTVDAYSITSSGASAGFLTLLQGYGVAAGAGPISPSFVAVNAADSFAYVLDSSSSGNKLYCYSISAGALSACTTPYVNTGNVPTSIALGNAGNANGYAYVTNATDHTISVYHLVSGIPVAASTANLAAGASPQSIVINSAGTYAYVVNNGTSTVSVFSIGASGALTEIAGSPVSTVSSPFALALDASAALLYVTGPVSIAGYAVTANSGALTPLAGSPFSALGTPLSITMGGLPPSGG